jgi:hypothetical protein
LAATHTTGWDERRVRGHGRLCPRTYALFHAGWREGCEEHRQPLPENSADQGPDFSNKWQRRREARHATGREPAAGHPAASAKRRSTLTCSGPKDPWAHPGTAWDAVADPGRGTGMDADPALGPGNAVCRRGQGPWPVAVHVQPNMLAGGCVVQRL